MTTIAVPGVTGRIDPSEWSALLRYWLDDEPTGQEYGLLWVHGAFLSHFWGLTQQPEQLDPPADPSPPSGENSLRERAAALAVKAPHVVAQPPARPSLSGNLAEDVRTVCGLTWAQVAAVFGISERAVAGWRSQGVPRHRTATMEALRAIGAVMVGGLGPEGVCGWLTAGEPSRLQRIGSGELENVVAEAHAYQDSPAT